MLISKKPQVSMESWKLPLENESYTMLTSSLYVPVCFFIFVINSVYDTGKKSSTVAPFPQFSTPQGFVWVLPGTAWGSGTGYILLVSAFWFGGGGSHITSIY